MSDPLPSYKLIASSKQRQRQSQIPPEWLLPRQYDHLTNLMHVPEICGILTDEEIDITSHFDATGLLHNMRNGTWTAEKVVTAFCKRAAIAHQLVCTAFHSSNKGCVATLPRVVQTKAQYPPRATAIPSKLTPSPDKLPHRDILLLSNIPRPRPRSCESVPSNHPSPPPPRPPHLPQRQLRRSRPRHLHRPRMLRRRPRRAAQRYCRAPPGPRRRALLQDEPPPDHHDGRQRQQRFRAHAESSQCFAYGWREYRG